MRRRKDVTDAELGVLEALWKHGPATIGRITDELYPERTTAKYATVQKLLERLEGKRCVRRDRRSFAHTFRATIERADLIDQGLRGLAEKLCDGSLTPLLLHLTEATKLTKKDREELRKLIDEVR